MSRFTRLPAGLLAAMFAVVLLALPVHAQTPAEIKPAAAASVKKLGLQTDLPRPPPPNPDERWTLPRWLERLLDASAGGNRAVVGIVLILAGAVLVYAFRDQIMTLLRRGEAWDTASAGGEERLTLESAAKTSAAADELAARGLFREAMHVLLLRALAEIRQRRGEHFADSLTSREVLRQVRLPEPGRASLRDIIAAVEWTYFGEHPAAANDYAACRDSFGRFVHALQEARA